ncbi:hypothetical protein KEJ27_08555 [Candidatus Bathyarchaeota archaeon]|nr:hypothetical protein [Candidatus Bathyarchaeota archaeon]
MSNCGLSSAGVCGISGISSKRDIEKYFLNSMATDVVVVGEPLPGYICDLCGSVAFKIARVDGRQKALCEDCLNQLLDRSMDFSEPVIQRVKGLFENCKIPGEDYVELSTFRSMLEKVFQGGAEKVLQSLLRKGLITEVRPGFLKWVG